MMSVEPNLVSIPCAVCSATSSKLVWRDFNVLHTQSLSLLPSTSNSEADVEV